ncbi:MAG TPA: hypothetical protein VMX58_09380 [Patescibacteria group bacterium]|nr:hypothetical protein [Patescibacteria group bacterium]
MLHWYFPEKYIDFVPPASVEIIPNFDYTEPFEYQVSNGICDGNENLIFYVINCVIFNQYGGEGIIDYYDYVQHEIVMIQNPYFSSDFFLFEGRLGGLYYCKLTFSEYSIFGVGRGKLQPGWTKLVDLYNVGTCFAVTQPSLEEYYVYFTTDDSVERCTVGNYVHSPVTIYSGTFGGYKINNVELEINCDGTKLAGTVQYYNDPAAREPNVLFVMDLDMDGLYVDHTLYWKCDVSPYEVPGVYAITGLEFSPDGEKLYVNFHDLWIEPPGDNTGIYWVDLSTKTLSPSPVPGSELYHSSMLELARNDLIYVCSPGDTLRGIDYTTDQFSSLPEATIEGVDVPEWPIDVSFYPEEVLMQKVLPDQIDCYDYIHICATGFPTDVQVSSFEAVDRGIEIELIWVTVSEIENAGFRLHRSTDGTGDMRQLNENLIAGSGSELAGARYSFVDRDVIQGIAYQYLLESVDIHGNGEQVGPITVTAGSGEGNVPAFSLAQNIPNPFNPSTKIEYGLAADCHIDIGIYDIQGRRVVTLVDQYMNAGTYSVTWDGRGARGAEASSGVYFCMFRAGRYMEVRKMTLLR